ncbi:MAG: putative Ig domain-containing protein [Acidobacteriota bacterium]
MTWVPTNRLVIARALIWTTLCAIGFLFLLSQEVQASHFRFGTLNWEPTGKSGEVRFRLIAAFRRDGFRGTAQDGYPQTGDSISENIGTTNLIFGDNSNTPTLEFVIIAFSAEDNFIIGEALNPGTTARGVLHTYSGTGPFAAGITDCCRISDLNNRRGGSYVLQTIVTPQNGNRNAVSTLVPLVRVSPGATSSFFVPAVDPDGDRLRWRLSTDVEAGGGSHPPNLTVDSETGKVTWNNTGLNQNLFWTTQVVIEDLDANGNVKSKTPIDFFLKIGITDGNVPSCSIIPSGPFAATPGTAISFKVSGTDPDVGDTLTLNTGGLPNGATMSPALPMTGASGINSTFNWIPGVNQEGSFVVVYSVTDSKFQQSLCSARIDVTAGSGKADLAIGQTATPNPAQAGGRVTYTFNVANLGTISATSASLTTQLASGVTFQSLTVPGGWNCNTPAIGAAGNVTCTTASLSAGLSANFTLVTNVGCQISDGTTISTTVSVTAANDANAANNQATSSIIVSKSQQFARVTLDSGKSSFELGAISALREPTASAPTEGFTVENSGCAALTIKLQRTGVDVSNGKISNPDDSAVFSLIAVGANGSEQIVPINPGSPPLQLAGGQSQRFKLRFHPLIPTLSGKNSGLFANQAIPDLITSQLIFQQDGGSAMPINITARVTTPLQLINPFDPRLTPLIVFTRVGAEYTVECSVHDPNLDLYLARYQFLDQNDRAVGGPADVDLVQPIAQRGLVRGQSFTIIQKFTGVRSEVTKVRITLYDRETNVVSATTALGTAEPVLASVSAASFQATALATEAIAAGFGTNLSGNPLSATTTPLPTNLNGTSVKVRDGAGMERLAPLFFVAPTQINYQIPSGTSIGAATVTVLRNGQAVAREVAQIGASAPAIFAANSNGQGVAAAIALRASANGAQQYDPVAKFDQARNQFVTLPLNFGAASDQLFLLLFGSGIRFGKQVSVKVGGIDAQVFYAGAQGGFVGLDQINALLPRSLAGRGEIEVVVTVDGKASNIVKINVGGNASFAANQSPAQIMPLAISAEPSAGAPILRLPAITFDGRFYAPERANRSQPKTTTKQQEQQP